MTQYIKHNLLRIRERITTYEKKYYREPGSVELIAVSKGQPIEKIIAAKEAGQTRFGENHLQEALTKITALNDASLEWHFIGSIQRNKTKKIAEHFSWVHSVSSELVAKRLNEQRSPHLPPLNICIEVNISNEITKSGIRAEDVYSLAAYCALLPRLRLRGLMVIPSRQTNFEKQCQAFRALFAVWQQLHERGLIMDTLSTGMSDDFEAAIAEGSTMLRIGKAIFA